MRLDALGGFLDAREENPPDALSETLLRLDDLAVAIVAAVAAHTMRKLHFAALRANGAGGRINAVVNGATRTGANATHLLLRYSHDLTPSIARAASVARNSFH